MLRPHIYEAARLGQLRIFYVSDLLGVHAFDVCQIAAVDEAPLLLWAVDSQLEFLSVANHIRDVRAEKRYPHSSFFRPLKSNQTGCLGELVSLGSLSREVVPDGHIGLRGKTLNSTVRVDAIDELVGLQRRTGSQQLIDVHSVYA